MRTLGRLHQVVAVVVESSHGGGGEGGGGNGGGGESGSGEGGGSKGGGDEAARAKGGGGRGGGVTLLITFGVVFNHFQYSSVLISIRYSIHCVFKSRPARSEYR